MKTKTMQALAAVLTIGLVSQSPLVAAAKGNDSKHEKRQDHHQKQKDKREDKRENKQKQNQKKLQEMKTKVVELRAGIAFHLKKIDQTITKVSAEIDAAYGTTATDPQPPAPAPAPSTPPATDGSASASQVIKSLIMSDDNQSDNSDNEGQNSNNEDQKDNDHYGEFLGKLTSSLMQLNQVKNDIVKLQKAASVLKMNINTQDLLSSYKEEQLAAVKALSHLNDAELAQLEAQQPPVTPPTTDPTPAPTPDPTQNPTPAPTPAAPVAPVQ